MQGITEHMENNNQEKEGRDYGEQNVWQHGESYQQNIQAQRAELGLKW